MMVQRFCSIILPLLVHLARADDGGYNNAQYNNAQNNYNNAQNNYNNAQNNYNNAQNNYNNAQNNYNNAQQNNYNNAQQNNYNANQQDEYNGNNGGYNYNGNNGGNDYQVNNYENGDDYIKYWQSYHIRPRRCVVYEDVDSIVFEIFGNDNQCQDSPTGTYVTDVPSYMDGYLKEYAQKMEDRGVDDYAEPDVAQYVVCTAYEINGEQYFMQLGCADDTTQSIAVNIYTDNTCTTRSNFNGYNDASFDISEIQVPFKHCQACVNWITKDDDEIDDQYFENRMTQAPLCSTAWAYKKRCGRKCQHVGLAEEKEGWNAADKLLLCLLGSFGAIMMLTIWHKRRGMPNKDALLEQAAMNAAGLQVVHILGLFVLLVLVIAVFAALGLKNVTWTLLLGVNFALFAYLMKLTFDSSTGEPIVGPDGEILRQDSDESSVEEASREEGAAAQPNPNNGTYMLPTLA